MVFILYAEDRGLLSTDEVFTRYYSITGLYERLKIDDGRYPDTMDQRFGAWAQLLTLFRLIYRGGSHGGLRIPAREGYLFDPDRYLFLEGRSAPGDLVSVPRVPDGVLFRVLSKLMLLDGERISYRTLAVEQIGSVYEAIMGFELHVASGPSIAIKPVKRHGAPTTINLEQLLRNSPDKRAKWFTEQTDQKITGQAADALKSASDINGLMSALDRKIASAVTPGIVAKGAMIFQPSDERRRSGSHYTPSSLTGPIVQAALEPVLKQLGDNPTPEQILALKVCDPAMGSGAFLVEACRQLGDALSRAWHAHNQTPILPPDEDESLHAQRQIAQRCLYGVDKNPMAADLAKLSLWLATLAKDHPFTFLDHALRSGDSLVGLSRKQITAFHWDKTDAQQSFLEDTVRARLRRIGQYRQRILDARDLIPYAQLEQHLEAVDQDLGWLRRIGDTVIAAFFSAEKPKAREAARQGLRDLTEKSVRSVIDLESNVKIEEAVAKLYTGPNGIRPFHWELEFPEVFRLDECGDPRGGFDAFFGNPPFLGGKLIATNLGQRYNEFLKEAFEDSKGAADLCAYFFRRSYCLLQNEGAMGLIATNTIAQADTREVGLDWIIENGGEIFSAVSRVVWPGAANVHVSVLHISNGRQRRYRLNGKTVIGITSYLTAGDPRQSQAPSKLEENFPQASGGTGLLGVGFVIEPETYRSWISTDRRYLQVLKPYINGQELNSMYEDIPVRYVIDFGEMSEEEASSFPLAMERVRSLVKPERDKLTKQIHEKSYWKHWDKRTELYAAIMPLRRVLVCSFISSHLPFTFLPPNWIYSKQLVVIPSDDAWAFAMLQSNAHSIWARLQSATMKSDLSYSIGDALRTFPLPRSGARRVRDAGEVLFEARREIVSGMREGLTSTYNRFHDPNEDSTDILRLRELHAAMDRAVLDAYGWQDIVPVCEFIPEFDDEEDEDDNGRPKKKKFRYKWPEAIHDEILARLLELNRQRAEEERREAGDLPVVWEDGLSDSATKPKRGRGKNAAKNDTIAEKPTLFNADEQEV